LLPGRLAPVGGQPGPQAVEDFHRKAFRVGVGLEHQRRDRAEQYGLSYPGGAVAADVAGDFAAAGGMADQDRVMQIQRLNEGGQIVGVGVEVVAVPGLTGTPAAAAVVGDGAIALGGDEEQLFVPHVGGQRPAVAEDDWLAGAPVLVKDFRTVGSGDGAHRASPSWVCRKPGGSRPVRASAGRGRSLVKLHRVRLARGALGAR
jgi:hypothetical protein